MARVSRSSPSDSSGVQQPVLTVSITLNEIAKQEDVPRTMYMGILTAVERTLSHSRSRIKQKNPDDTTQIANESTAKRCRSIVRSSASESGRTFLPMARPAAIKSTP